MNNNKVDFLIFFLVYTLLNHKNTFLDLWLSVFLSSEDISRYKYTFPTGGGSNA